MQAAGPTHGCFYKHFASRDDLVAEAAERTFADSRQATAAVDDPALSDEIIGDVRAALRRPGVNGA